MAKQGINKVIILGRIGNDPETRYLPNGDVVASMSVATSEKWKDKNTGEPKESTEWHRVVLWRKLGEIAAEYCKKGNQVYIEGKLATRKWQDQGGVDRYTTEIVAEDMQLLGGKRDEQQTPQQASYDAQKPAAQPSGGGDFEDDIPFVSVMNCHAI